MKVAVGVALGVWVRVAVAVRVGVFVAVAVAVIVGVRGGVGVSTANLSASLAEVARQIGANDQAIEQVKEALKGRQIDVKLGSWKGKPIYLSDALKVGGIADAVRRLFK